MHENAIGSYKFNFFTTTNMCICLVIICVHIKPFIGCKFYTKLTLHILYRYLLIYAIYMRHNITRTFAKPEIHAWPLGYADQVQMN